MDVAINQAELFPNFYPRVKARSRVRQFIDATFQHGPLLTPSLAAEALGISRQRLHVLINADRIATIDVAGERFVPASAVDLFKAEPARHGGRPWPSFRSLLKEADRVSDEILK